MIGVDRQAEHLEALQKKLTDLGYAAELVTRRPDARLALAIWHRERPSDRVHLTLTYQVSHPSGPDRVIDAADLARAIRAVEDRLTDPALNPP